MSDSFETPNWLREALQDHTVGVKEFREDNPADLLPGDVVVVGPYEDASAFGNLFVVVDAENGCCKGMLAVAEIEHAIDVDAVLAPGETGLSYPVAVLTRFQGPVWAVQVRQRVGAIETHVLEELEKLSWNDDPAGISLRRGLPLLPEGIDPRYPDRRTLSLEFDRLTENYRRRCHGLLPIIDPTVAEADILPEFLSEPGWEQHTRFMSVPHEFQQNLATSITALSNDQQLAARTLIEKSLHCTQRRNVSSEPDSTMATHRASHTLASTVFGQQDPLPATLVLTHPKCWEGSVPEFSRLESKEAKTLVYYNSEYYFSEKEPV